jgi:hypothetical protein
MHDVQSPRTDDSAIEQEILAKGLTAPRVTPGDIEANIAGEYYFTAQDGVVGESVATGKACGDGTSNPLNLLTFCVLVLRNGFTVTGESACASPENFDADLGKKIARAAAVNKVWPLMGYELKQKLALIPEGLAAAQRPGMTVHLGSKAIRAKAMTRQAYNDLRGWALPADEDGTDAGMLVEYLDGGKANVPGFDGYVSWSPIDVFNRAYPAI